MAARRTTTVTQNPSEKLSIEVEVGGKTKSVKFTSFTLMPLGILRANRDNEQALIWAGFEWALSPADLAILDEVPSSRLYETWNKMQAASRATLGESSASSTS